MLTRRFLLKGAITTTFVVGGQPLLASDAQGRDPRLIFVILRGGLDGLAAVPAPGDSAYHRARGGLASLGNNIDMFELDDLFGLHGGLEEFHSLYQAGDLAVVHAVAPPYRARSHFDAQDVLESGLLDPSASATGWLYRALQGEPGGGALESRAMALGGAIPLVLRGTRSVGAWAPDRLPDADADTLARVARLYQDDAVLGPRLNAAFDTEDMVAGLARRRSRDGLQQSAAAAAQFLTHVDGPRIAVMESGGWDTHANQPGQLNARLQRLSRVIGTLRESLDSVWDDTVIVLATEFGRTVAMNGTRGSDHGVGGVAFVAGGGVRGGQVLADWPGLARDKLYEGRDLQPTTDVRSIFKSVLLLHLGQDENAVDALVFSDRRLPLLPGLFTA